MMVQLNDLLPLSQRDIYWTCYGSDHEGVPDDAVYVIFEYYCNTKGCDCQRLVADIMLIGEDGEHIEQSLAVISYDWSSHESECYPILTEESPKTPLALKLLEVYETLIHCSEYLIRIKKQYAQVRRLAAGKSLKMPARAQTVFAKKMAGRNEACPCGSGKKYKKCCLTD